MSVAFLSKLNDPGIYELLFGIEERDMTKTDDWRYGRDYSIETSKRYVPKEHRRQVLSLVLDAIECILKQLPPCPKPIKIAMKSFYRRSLTARALQKYEEICAVMQRNGYEVKQDFVDETTHRHIWLFEQAG